MNEQEHSMPKVHFDRGRHIPEKFRNTFEMAPANEAKVLTFAKWFNDPPKKGLILVGPTLYSKWEKDQQVVNLFISLTHRNIDDFSKFFFVPQNNDWKMAKRYLNGKYCQFLSLGEDDKLDVIALVGGLNSHKIEVYHSFYQNFHNFLARSQEFVFAGDKTSIDTLLDGFKHMLAQIGIHGKKTSFANGFLLENGHIHK